MTASVLGYPDVELQTVPEILNQARNIARSVSIPVVVDTDTGYSNALNVIRAVREFEAAGLAGMMEDQTFPKKCGHFEGKSVLSPEEIIIKAKAAVEARRSDDFVVVARTDSRATHGLEDVIEGANLYAEAGADIIFADALLSFEDVRAFARGVNAPTKANLSDGGKPRWFIIRTRYGIQAYLIFWCHPTICSQEHARCTGCAHVRRLNPVDVSVSDLQSSRPK